MLGPLVTYVMLNERDRRNATLAREVWAVKNTPNVVPQMRLSVSPLSRFSRFITTHQNSLKLTSSLDLKENRERKR